MISYILILAHLAVDFLFQPAKLVEWKAKSNWGIFVHVAILAAICVILFIPYLDQALIWYFIAILVVTHFIQDKVKVWYEANYNKSRKSYPFFVDQFIHVAVIFFVARYLFQHLRHPEIEIEFLKNIYFNETLYLYASLLILFSYALDIIIFQLKRERNPGLKYKRDYDSITKRVFAFALFYTVFLIVSARL